jgi:uncharacterized phage protein (TIGR02218 family)
MTYAAHETSQQGGRPVEVYRFTAGAASYFYTSSESQEPLGAQIYTPIALKRSSNAEGPEERDRSNFSVVLPTSDPVAQIYAGQLPGVRVRLTVSRFHRDDTPTPEVVTVFDGYVQGASFENGLKECRLTARALMASMGREMPARTCQGRCNHVLYDPLTCRVDDTDPAFRASLRSVTSQVGNLLTVAGLGSYAAGWFTGGYVEAVGVSDYRMVLDDDGAGGLTLMAPFATEPSLVNVFAGCAHNIAICKSKFDNVINYGGFAFVPVKNPFESGID